MKQPNNAKIYNTALYMRLSRDDENYGDSVSIETQRTILRQYAKEQGLPVVGEYVDDGWSGTNFERPGFQRMMDDVEAGKVNCIVTKDLSRFGREHVMMDYYLEFIFPEKQVRYIAVTENEDTEKGLSDFVPFKNLFNEWFAKDTSRKVKAALHAKFAAGQRTFAYAPLGYKRHPEVKNALAIDEETRWIVEKIFDLAVHDTGAARITRILVNEKVPTPGWINYKRDGTFANIYAGAPEEKAYAWTITQVKSILKDETYIGNSIHNKQTNISYKNKKKVRKPKEEWFRVEDTHEPLVSKEDFARVQELIATRRRQQKDGSTQIFSGLVKCADCGWSLAFSTNRQNKKPYSYYHCSKNGQGLHQCTMHYIRYDVLYTYVLARVRSWAGQAALHEKQQHPSLARRTPAHPKRTFHRLYTFRIPHLSAPCVYIPPRFVLCSGQKGGSPMDQIKIGRFVAETRRAKGLTQRQLADQLSISDKTISKWETGKGLPDVSLMLPLCQALDITVNDLLTGVRVSASDYQKKAEENMMDLIKENQENKKRFALSMVCAAITVIAVVALVFLASYLDLPVPARVAVLALAVATAVAGIGAAAILEAQAGYYECPACHELFVPTLGEYVRGYHTLTKRRLTCPHCGKTGMCRHKIVR